MECFRARSIVFVFCVVSNFGHINYFTFRLEEAEERYLNREPREEDLNMIEQLRRMLTQREQEMQQLLVGYL